MIARRWMFSAIASALLLTGAGATAQEKETGSKPDIGVMNSVIRELMTKVYGTHDRIDVDGAYLPNRGVLFVVNPPFKIDLGINIAVFDSVMSNFHVTMEHFDSAMAHFDSSMSKHGQAAPRPAPAPAAPRVKVEVNKEKNDYSEGQYEAVMTFLKNYADVENKLAPTDEVIVVVLTDGESGGRVFEVSKKNIEDARTGRITGEQFKQRVKITEIKHEGGDSSVDIMETIIDKSLSGSSRRWNDMALARNTRGVYLKGIGALFIRRATDMYFPGEDEEESEPRKEDSEKLTGKVIQVLGTYGPTLRFLPENESIYVLIARHSYGYGGNNLIVALSKKNIEAYSRNEINLETLRSRATVIQEQ